MGAHSFRRTFNVTTFQELKDQFDQESSYDRRENGSGSYSGSIGQKTSVRLVKHDPVPPSEFEALRELDYGDKWDDCALACPIALMKPVGKVKSVSKIIEILGDIDTAWKRDRWMHGAVRINLPSGAEIVGDISFDLVSSPVYKVKKIPSEGWYIIRENNNRTLYTSKKEAMDAAKSLCMDWGDIDSKTERISVVNLSGGYERVMSKPAKYKLVFKYKNTEVVDEISHYEVWGMAAD